MSYVLVADVRGPSGFTDATAFPDNYIQGKIDAARDLINGKIGDAYTLPLNPIPDIIVQANLEIAIALLQIDQYGDEAKDGDKGWARRLNLYLNDPTDGGDKGKPMGILVQIQNLKLKLMSSSGVELQRNSLRKPAFYPTNSSSAATGSASTAPVITKGRKF